MTLVPHYMDLKYFFAAIFFATFVYLLLKRQGKEFTIDMMVEALFIPWFGGTFVERLFTLADLLIDRFFPLFGSN